MNIYFNSQRQYLLSIIKYLQKTLPKSMLQILRMLEDLQEDDISSFIRTTFQQYHKIYQSRKNEWPEALYAINMIYHILYYNTFQYDTNFLYWIDCWINDKQKIPAVARFNFEKYLEIQKMNIFGFQGGFNMDFVSEQVYNAALDIHIKRHWQDLPMFSDICISYGLTDNTIIEYLRNTKLHQDLMVHCWIIELILRADINKDAVNEDDFQKQQWLGW